MATVTASNILQGAGTLWTAPFGEAEPADTAVASDPTGNWRDVGATDGGLEFVRSPDYSVLTVDQVSNPVGRRLVGEEIRFVTALAEATLENLDVVISGLTTNTGAGFESREPAADLAATADPTYYAFLFDGFAPGAPQKRRRIIMRRGLVVAETRMAYTKDGKTMIPAEITAHYVSTSIREYKIIDEV